MKRTICPICSSIFTENSCPTCLYKKDTDQEQLLDFIEEKFKLLNKTKKKTKKLNLSVYIIRSLSLLDNEKFLELDWFKIYTAVYYYCVDLNGILDWDEVKLTNIETILRYLERTISTGPLEIQKVHKAEKDFTSQKSKLKKKKLKGNVIRDLIKNGNLQARVKEDPYYDGYYDYIEPIDYDQIIKAEPPRNSYSKFTPIGLILGLSILTVIFFMIPFIN